MPPPEGPPSEAYDDAMAVSHFPTLACGCLATPRFASHTAARMVPFRSIEDRDNPHRGHSTPGKRARLALEQAHALQSVTHREPTHTGSAERGRFSRVSLAVILTHRDDTHRKSLLTTRNPMRQRDQFIFAKAAQRHGAWIFVRDTNVHSLQYIGRHPYEPKPISCKPKTAPSDPGLPNKKTAGLVTDPIRWPDAFGAKQASAADIWIQFITLHGLGRWDPVRKAYAGPTKASFGFGINAEPGSPHEGCLTLEGKYLYGDYDLFDIVLLSEIQKNEGARRVPVMTGPRNVPVLQTRDLQDPTLAELRVFVNGQVGREVIRHGSQFAYAPGLYEDVWAFSPLEGSLGLWKKAILQQHYQKWGRDKHILK